MQAGQALIKAIGWREWEEAKKIVTDDATGQLMSYIDNEGRNPLHRACSRGAPADLMHVILSVCNEDILMARDNNGLTPLHWAVSSSVDEAMISMVIEACPQATTVMDKAGRTPHDLAKGRKKSPAILQQLQDAVKMDELQSKGNAALMEGNTAKAIKYYSRCIETYGATGILYSNRSAAHLIAGDVQSALDDADRCLELIPDSVEGYLRKGSALRAYSMDDEAAATFRDGLARCPDDPDLLASLSELEHDEHNAEMTVDCEANHCDNAEMTVDSQEFSCEVNQSECQETIVGDVGVDTEMYTSEIERLQEEIANIEKNHEMNMNDMHVKLEEMEKKYEEEMEHKLIELERKHEAELDEVRREAQESGDNRAGEVEQVKREAEEAANGYTMEIEDIKREAEEALQLQESEMMTEIENLRNELQEVKDKNSELEASIKKVQDIKENQEMGSEAEIKDLNEQIDELRTQVEFLKNERKSHDDELEELKKSTSTQISKLRIDVEVLGEEKDTLEMDLTDAQMKLTSQEEMNKEIKEKNEEMQMIIDKIIGKAEESVKAQQAWVDTLRSYGGKSTDGILSPKRSTTTVTGVVKTSVPKPSKDVTPKANNLLSSDCTAPTTLSSEIEQSEENDENNTLNAVTPKSDTKANVKVGPKIDMKCNISTINSSSPSQKSPSFRVPTNAPHSVRGRTGKIAGSSGARASTGLRSASPMRAPSPSPMRGPSPRPGAHGLRGPSPRVGVVTRPR